MDELKPCPFCGGEVKLMAIAGEPYPPTYEVDLSRVDEQSDDICFVHCPKCKADWNIELRIDSFPLDTIAAWNRRADHLPDATKMVSNADRMRGMSDEELHKFLLDFEAGDIDYAKTFCDLCCKDAALERKSTDCEGCLLWWLKNDATLPQGIDWLRQPVKEEQ